MSTVAIATMTEDEARRLTERIRLTAHTFAESRTKLIELVEEAKTGNAHLALGYTDWRLYLSETLGDEPMRLARDDRKEFVGILAAEGMSTRAIAPIVGASIGQVHADRSEMNSRPNAPERPAKVMSLDGRERPAKVETIRVDLNTGEVLDPIVERHRTDVVRVINAAINKAEQASAEATQIKREHLRGRKEEAAVWSRRLNEAMAGIQTLANNLKEMS